MIKEHISNRIKEELANESYQNVLMVIGDNDSTQVVVAIANAEGFIEGFAQAMSEKPAFATIIFSVLSAYYSIQADEAQS